MAKSLQEQRDDFLLAVGQCLQAWAGVEEAVILLFSEAIQAEPKRLGILIMSAIVSFEAKVKVTNEVMQFRLADDPDLPVWNKLCARILKFYGKRHEIAHFNLVTNIDEKGSTIQLQPYGFLVSARADARSPINVPQIRERAAKFDEIRDAVQYFMWAKLLAHNWPDTAESEWLIPDLIQRLRTLIAQFREETQPS